MSFSSDLGSEPFLRTLMLKKAYTEADRLVKTVASPKTFCAPSETEMNVELPRHMVLMNLFNPPLLRMFCEEVLDNKSYKLAHSIVRPYLSFVEAAGTNPMSIINQTGYDLFVGCALSPKQTKSSSTYSEPIRNWWGRCKGVTSDLALPRSLIMANDFVELMQKHGLGIYEELRAEFINIGQTFFAKTAESLCHTNKTSLNPDTLRYRATHYMITTMLQHIAAPARENVKPHMLSTQGRMRGLLSDLAKREPDHLRSFIQDVYSQGNIPVSVHNVLHKFRKPIALVS